MNQLLGNLVFRNIDGDLVPYHSPRDKYELQWMMWLLFGAIVPDNTVCPGHSAPLDALAASYFATAPVIVWKASRGLGGKTTLLAGLAMLELLDGANVTVLGGSGRQSQRVHELEREAWKRTIEVEGVRVNTPLRHFIPNEPTSWYTETTAGNKMVALTASTKSARGPHPQRVRMDECISGDNLIDTPSGRIKMRDLKIGDVIYSCDGERPVEDRITAVLNKGLRLTVEVCFSDGSTIVCTPDHLFMTREGWEYAANLEGKEVIRGERTLSPQLTGRPNQGREEDGRIEKSGLLDFGSVDRSNAFMALSGSRCIKVGNHASVEVWDISVAKYPTFFCEGKVVHNCDEMRSDVFNAAMGQAMSRDGIPAQTTLSSTQQYPDGTMAAILKLAAERGWPTFHWCFKETSVLNNGWLAESEIEDKRNSVTDMMWNVEYELQEPSTEGRIFSAEALVRTFKPAIGNIRDRLGAYYEFEKPKDGARYMTSADWARDQDDTVIVTMRYDIKPARLVAYERTKHEPYPAMIGRFNRRLRRYLGKGIHDAAGVGSVVSDYIESDDVTDYNTTRKKDLYTDYVMALEGGRLESPMVDTLHSEHKYCTYAQLYRHDHPPDGISAMAIAWQGILGRVTGKTPGRIGRARKI